MNKQKLTIILSIVAAVLLVVLIVLIGARSCGKNSTEPTVTESTVASSDASAGESDATASDSTEATESEEPGEVIIGIDDDIIDSNTDGTTSSNGVRVQAAVLTTVRAQAKTTA